MRRDVYEYVEGFVAGSPTWLKVGYSLGLIVAGVLWAWWVGRCGFHHDIAKLGFVAIGIGVVTFGLTLMSDDN
jgi:hypothetical protein